MIHFVLYTDGSYNPPRGGYAALAIYKNKMRVKYGRSRGDTSVDNMEIAAIAVALSMVPDGATATLFTDSYSAIDAIIHNKRNKGREKMVEACQNQMERIGKGKVRIFWKRRRSCYRMALVDTLSRVYQDLELYNCPGYSPAWLSYERKWR